MGYFKRKLDRGRARETIRELHDTALEEGEWAPWSAERGPPRRPCFLRFAIGEKDVLSERRRGVFTAAYALLRRAKLSDLERGQVGEELEWFGQHLPVPDLNAERAIFLFKSDAGESARRIWHLVHLLREHGLPTDMQVVENPGRVVYEDAYQVAVVPWSSQKGL